MSPREGTAVTPLVKISSQDNGPRWPCDTAHDHHLTTTHNRNDSRPEINSHTGWGGGAGGPRHQKQRPEYSHPVFVSNKQNQERTLHVSRSRGGCAPEREVGGGGWDVVIFPLCCWKVTHV